MALYSGIDGSEIIKTAGESISGGKAVIIGTDGKIYVFDITNENHYGKVCGIAKQAAVAGAPVEVATLGEVCEVGSGWMPGLIYYVGLGGTLTTTPPTSGIVHKIGVGLATDTILIRAAMEVITI